MNDAGKFDEDRMKKLSIYLLVFLLPLIAFSSQRLNVPASLETISALFPSQPQQKVAQNEPNTIANALVAATNDNVIYGITEIRKTDGSRFDALSSEYPYRIATGISSGGAISASVQTVSEEINSSMTFTLNLKHRDNIGVGFYWAAVRNGKTYQASTWCFGDQVESCNTFHQEFLETVHF
jgi:hypothetical protein